MSGGSWQQIGGQNVAAVSNDSTYLAHGANNSLTECQKSCTKTANCNLINWNSTSSNCVLRQCTDPLTPTLTTMQGFQVYVRSTTAAATNIPTLQTDAIKAFEKEAISYDNLYRTADSLTDAGPAATSINSVVQGQYTELKTRKDDLEKELASVQSKALAINRDFIDTRTANGDKPVSPAGLNPSLQDWALSLFVFSWLMCSILITALASVPPFGNWRMGLMTSGGVLVSTAIVYSLIVNFA